MSLLCGEAANVSPNFPDIKADLGAYECALQTFEKCRTSLVIAGVLTRNTTATQAALIGA